ncbi:MAG: osmoprotectant transport system substrate-binding protein [Solirubrobacteraceae bacterium]|jgi:osmoprotectant transport system substrate-binding protein|nr:osmoprotectant transport system substrate-binding protein [Solirubrobacteraceae bacterium]
MRSRWLAVATALTLLTTLAACGSSDKKSPSAGKGKPAVTLGDKNFTEQYILGELYAQALRAKGYTVKIKRNIGSSEITDKALTSGQIDLYPEYTGVIATELAKLGDQPASAQDTYDKAKAFEEKRGFALLDKTPFYDADGLAVKPAYATKYKLSDIGDLKNVPGTFKFGGPPENKTRYQGVVGMQKAYGLKNIEFKPLSIGLQYKALDTGKIDVAAVFTTDAQLAGGKLTVLKDSMGIFGYQNVAPVVNKKVLAAAGPEFEATLNAVSAKLTNEAMQSMNGAVDLDKKDAAAVAKAFLDANGLL